MMKEIYETRVTFKDNTLYPLLQKDTAKRKIQKI